MSEEGRKSLQMCVCEREFQSTRGLRSHHSRMGCVRKVCEKEVQQRRAFEKRARKMTGRNSQVASHSVLGPGVVPRERM